MKLIIKDQDIINTIGYYNFDITLQLSQYTICWIITSISKYIHMAWNSKSELKAAYVRESVATITRFNRRITNCRWYRRQHCRFPRLTDAIHRYPESLCVNGRAASCSKNLAGGYRSWLGKILMENSSIWSQLTDFRNKTNNLVNCVVHFDMNIDGGWKIARYIPSDATGRTGNCTLELAIRWTFTGRFYISIYAIEIYESNAIVYRTAFGIKLCVVIFLLCYLLTFVLIRFVLATFH